MGRPNSSTGGLPQPPASGGGGRRRHGVRGWHPEQKARRAARHSPVQGGSKGWWGEGQEWRRTLVVPKLCARGNGGVQARDLEGGVAGWGPVPLQQGGRAAGCKAWARRREGAAAGRTSAERAVCSSTRCQGKGAWHTKERVCVFWRLCRKGLGRMRPRTCMLMSQGGGDPSLMPSAAWSSGLSTPAQLGQGGMGGQVTGVRATHGIAEPAAFSAAAKPACQPFQPTGHEQWWLATVPVGLRAL